MASLQQLPACKALLACAACINARARHIALHCSCVPVLQQQTLILMLPGWYAQPRTACSQFDCQALMPAHKVPMSDVSLTRGLLFIVSVAAFCKIHGQHWQSQHVVQPAIAAVVDVPGAGVCKAHAVPALPVW